MSVLPLPSPPAASQAREPLTQIWPFNEVRFRLCMAYLTATKAIGLPQMTAANLSLLIDLFHILRRGLPVVGGSVAAWDIGPVVTEAYHLCDEWKARHDRSGVNPGGLRVVGGGARVARFKAAGPIDLDEFSALEIEAMERAWGEIGHLNSAALRRYTCGPDTFLGQAWAAARAADHRQMGWDQIIDAWDRCRGEDHSSMKELIGFRV